MVVKDTCKAMGKKYTNNVDEKRAIKVAAVTFKQVMWSGYFLIIVFFFQISHNIGGETTFPTAILAC